MTGFRESSNPEVLKDLDTFGWGNKRTLKEFEDYSGVDFKRKIASEKALRCLFIKDLDKYRDGPIYVPELDGRQADRKPKPEMKKPAQNGHVNGAQRAHEQAPCQKWCGCQWPRAIDAPAAPAKPPKLLEPGDFIPLFELPDTNRKIRLMEVHGGRHSMLAFLPSDQPEYLNAFLQEHSMHSFQQFSADKAEGMGRAPWHVMVLDDTVG